MQCLFNRNVSKLFVPLALMAVAAFGQRTYPSLGTSLSQDEIKSFDMIVGPEGKELPPGQGTSKEGADVFAKKCAVCHGRKGEGGSVQHLVLGGPGNPKKGPWKDTEKSAVSYYPYPTIAWDYINRAMPANKPGSLTPDEVYSVVAWLYYMNGIIGENDVMDAKSLVKVQMPNRDGFVPAKPVWPPNPKKPSWY
jgi:S-disulfanyl-L-cysteine oxidoreductase SoxD